MAKEVKPKAKAMKVKTALRYGMSKVRVGQKIAWITEQNKNGFSLGLALNSHTVWLRNLRFKSLWDLKAAINGKVSLVTVLKKLK